MSLGKILVVDDERNLVEVIQMGLEAAGYEVVAAYDEKGAIEKVKDRSLIFPSLIFSLSIRMAYQLLMEDLHLIIPQMPVIILTGHGSIESAVKAMKQGAYSYLTKPFESQALLFEIQKAMENRRLSSRN